MSADGAKQRNPKRPARPSPQALETQPASSEGGFQAAHLFALFSLVAAGGGIVAVGAISPATVVFVSLAIGSAGVAAYLLYLTVWPLLAPEHGSGPEMVGGRTRAALEREKAATLRAIKELEFDRAMRKVSEADFQDMSLKLRARAVGLIKQLDVGGAGYRDLIERDLAARVAVREPAPNRALSAVGVGDENPAEIEPASQESRTCRGCGAHNDPDAQFCKQCGIRLVK